VDTQKAGDRELGRDRVDMQLGITVPPILDATFELAVGMLGEFLWSAPRTSKGALRNFASHAAYLTMASLPGASTIRTTIQLMSGAGWSRLYV